MPGYRPYPIRGSLTRQWPSRLPRYELVIRRVSPQRSCIGTQGIDYSTRAHRARSDASIAQLVTTERPQNHRVVADQGHGMRTSAGPAGAPLASPRSLRRLRVACHRLVGSDRMVAEPIPRLLELCQQAGICHTRYTPPGSGGRLYAHQLSY